MPLAVANKRGGDKEIIEKYERTCAEPDDDDDDDGNG